MKRILIVLLVCLLANVCVIAQNNLGANTLDKTWVGKDGHYLEINGDNARLCLERWPRSYFVDYHDSLLVLRNSSDKSIWATSPPSDVYFKVTRLAADTLVLLHMASPNYASDGGGKELLFINKRILDTVPIHFERLNYSCVGGLTGINFHLAIDSNGNVHMMNRILPDRKNVLYKGTLSKEDMRKLKILLQTSALDIFGMVHGRKMADASRTSFTCYYNCKVAHGEGVISPAYACNLFVFFNKMGEDADLELDDGTYTFEK